MNWYVIYTKPKCEDSTAFHLRNAGMETLSPKIKTRKFIRGKYIPALEPLFPGYIFACFDCEKHGHMIKYTRGVKFIVGKQKPMIVPQEIIEMILGRLQNDIIVSVPENLEKGDKVLIKEGPFANFYGIFVRNIPGRERAMILLETLQCKLEIEHISLQKA